MLESIKVFLSSDHFLFKSTFRHRGNTVEGICVSANGQQNSAHRRRWLCHLPVPAPHPACLSNSNHRTKRHRKVVYVYEELQ